MNYKLSVLVLLFACFAFLPVSRAGFWLKRHAISVSANSAVQNAEASPFKSDLITQAKAIFDNKPDHKGTSAGVGIASLVCGILGLYLPLMFLAIPAIIFGIVGLRRKRKCKGLALAGLILGCAVILFITLVAIANP